jgi:hypothetical protein
MEHEIHRVTSFQKVAPFTLRLRFEDVVIRTVDFKPVLAGELYGPLADEEAFDAVRLDEEAHTLVWPNGADFDPAMLYNWAECGPAFEKLAKTWNVSVR